MIGPQKCQYCGQQTENGYTCKECNETFPWRECRCENNGDGCDSCNAWMEKRQALKEQINAR